jgi:hypothetical protein
VAFQDIIGAHVPAFPLLEASAQPPTLTGPSVQRRLRGREAAEQRPHRGRGAEAAEGRWEQTRMRACLPAGGTGGGDGARFAPSLHSGRRGRHPRQTARHTNPENAGQLPSARVDFATLLLSSFRRVRLRFWSVRPSPLGSASLRTVCLTHSRTVYRHIAKHSKRRDARDREATR